MVDDWFPIKMNEAEGLCDDEEKRVHIQVCYKPAGVRYKIIIYSFNHSFFMNPLLTIIFYIKII